jgi:uncharacterized membrane protein YbhN (UPF0104 family)
VRSVVGQVPRRAAIGSLVAAAAFILLAVAPHTLGPDLARAFAAFSAAQPVPLCVGCGLFAASLLCSAGCWRTTVIGCGGRLGRSAAAANYGVGSLASTFFPARAGDAVRVALFSRALPHDRRVWTASGMLLALGAARAAVLCGLVVAAAALGAVPFWPLLALGGMLVVAAAVATKVRRTQARSRAGHILDAFRVLGRSPRTACLLAGWAAASIACRVAATAVAAAALGVSSPLLAALMVVPAMELAGLLPLTPGNLGVADGAAAVALHATGVQLSQAIAIAIALHGVETLASIAFGGWSALYLAGEGSLWARRLTSAVAGAAGVGAAAVAAILIAT